MKNKYYKSSRLSEDKFRSILKHFSLDIVASNTADLTNTNRNTINTIYQKLRERILWLTIEQSKEFDGEIEIDEAYFGAKRIRGKRGRGAKGKTPVIGLLQRNGHVYTKVVKNCTREELLPVIKGQVLEESTVYTDGWKSYDALVLNGYKHRRIYHRKDEFARGKNHINGIESFWSFTKTRLATLRGIRADKFLLHLKECEWRWNHRNDDLYKILLEELRKRPLN